MSTPQSSDSRRQLFERIRVSDEHALEELYAALHSALWRFAYRFVRASDVADDLVQDAFVTLWERRADIEVSTSVQNYLFGVIRHRAIDFMRRATATRTIEADAASRDATLGASTPPESADVAIDLQTIQDALTTAIARLPEARRTALVLRWEHGMSYDDIATVLKTSPAAARQLVTRARETLRLELAPYLLD